MQTFVSPSNKLINPMQLYKHLEAQAGSRPDTTISRSSENTITLRFAGVDGFSVVATYPNEHVCDSAYTRLFYMWGNEEESIEEGGNSREYLSCNFIAPQVLANDLSGPEGESLYFTFQLNNSGLSALAKELEALYH